MLIQQTVENLRRMRLGAMAEAFIAQTKNPSVGELSFEERFGLLVDHELTCRQNHRIARLLKRAHLKMSACMEDVDYQEPRGLDRAFIASLAACGWVLSHQSILVCGPTGVGKTYLCCALANQACRQGHSARYVRVPRLLSELAIARGDGSYMKVMNQLAKIDVLVLDDWGLTPLTVTEARDLLEVVEERYQTRSNIVASQLPVEDWYATMPDPTVADAIMDRLVHTAHKITLKGESMRKYKGKDTHPTPGSDAE